MPASQKSRTDQTMVSNLVEKVLLVRYSLEILLVPTLVSIFWDTKSISLTLVSRSKLYRIPNYGCYSQRDPICRLRGYWSYIWLIALYFVLHILVVLDQLLLYYDILGDDTPSNAISEWDGTGWLLLQSSKDIHARSAIKRARHSSLVIILVFVFNVCNSHYTYTYRVCIINHIMVIYLNTILQKSASPSVQPSYIIYN